MSIFTKIKLYMFYFVIYGVSAIPVAFIQVFLEYLGYDVVERGLMITSSAIVAIISQFLVGYIADKYKSDRLPFNITLIIIGIATVLLFLSDSKILLFHLVTVSLLLGLFKALNASQDAWILGIDESCKRDFGIIRAFASLGWVFGSYLGGIILEHFAYTIVAYMYTFFTIMVLIQSKYIPEGKRSPSSNKLSLKDIKVLFQYKGYCLVLVILLGVEIIFMSGQYTLVDKFIILGSETSMIGAYWSIQAFVELPLFFLAPKILNRFKDYHIILFATVIYIFRFILYAYVQTPNLLIIITLLQCISFPLLMIVSKTLVDRFTPENMKATGQTVAMAIYIGIPSLLVPIISGILIDMVNVDFALFVFALSGIIPIILTLYLMKTILIK